MKRIVTLCSLAALTLVACTKNKETTVNAPTITVNNTLLADTVCKHWEENVLKVSILDTLRLSLTLKGDIELSQYKIGVHENDPCHEHGEMPPNQSLDDKNYWHESRIENLSDKQHNVEEMFTFTPETTKGNYHLTIQLIDKNGNEAAEKELNVILVD